MKNSLPETPKTDIINIYRLKGDKMKKLLIFIMTVAVFLNITAYAYNKDLSLLYAQEHFDDGKGLCAEFVTDCLRAGGMEISANECDALVKELTEKYGLPIYPLAVNQDGRISLSKNADRLAVGDIIAQECHECKTFFHVVLVGGEHKDFITYYAHNAAHGNTEKDVFYNVPNYGHKGHTSVAYSIHFGESADLNYVLYTVQAGSGLNMRKAPSINGEIITTIENNSVVNICKELSREDWLYVFYNNQKGYVKKDYLKETVIHKDTEITVAVGDTTLAEKPIVIEGRTMLPVRAIFEALGGTVDWSHETKTATVTFEDKTVSIRHLEETMKVNGTEKNLLVPSVIIDGRMYVGARGVSEGIEKTVLWNNSAVTIN